MMPLKRPTILVFDSGLGGLTVYREIVAIRPDAAFIYVADDAGFPYGHWPESELAERVTAVIADLIARHQPDLVVIACNTASTLVLPLLRARFVIPFVGTVPAIKPACALSKTKRVSVLGTQATVTREYTHALVRDFAQGCMVTLVGSPALAILAEQYLRGEPVQDEAIGREIAPCFVTQDGAKTDILVLACTHFPLLRGPIARLSPWPVTLLDPAAAIARRVADLVGPALSRSQAPPSFPPARAHFTSGLAPHADLAKALAGFGLVAGV